MSDTQATSDTEPAADESIDRLHDTAHELAAVLADEDRDRAREIARELANDLGAFESDALWSELDDLREVREGIEPAPEKKVGDLHVSGTSAPPPLPRASRFSRS